MKKLVLFVVLVASLSAVADEYGYFSRASSASNWIPEQVTLQEGDVFEILFTTHSMYDIILLTDRHGTTHAFDYEELVAKFDSRGMLAYPAGHKQFVGPATISPNPAAEGMRYLSYKIVRAVDSSISPANVISLPADPGGDMQLVFESSDDLLNWTQEFSFTHNSGGQSAKFFRTRLVQGAGE